MNNPMHCPMQCLQFNFEFLNAPPPPEMCSKMAADLLFVEIVT